MGVAFGVRVPIAEISDTAAGGLVSQCDLPLLPPSIWLEGRPVVDRLRPWADEVRDGVLVPVVVVPSEEYAASLTW
jgi:hypothetical protein